MDALSIIELPTNIKKIFTSYQSKVKKINNDLEKANNQANLRREASVDALRRRQSQSE